MKTKKSIGQQGPGGGGQTFTNGNLLELGLIIKFQGVTLPSLMAQSRMPMSLSRILQKTSHWYFQPRKWETTDHGSVYDKIGIRWFKKYMPIGPLHISKPGKTKLEKTPGLKEALLAFEMRTRHYELRHILGTVGFIILIFILDKKLQVQDIVFLFLLNALVNLFPIFLQRHHRIRVLKILHTKGQSHDFLKSNGTG